MNENARAQQIVQQLDQLFETGRAREVGQFLCEKLEEALAADDTQTALTILNEQTGYYRSTGNGAAAAKSGRMALETAALCGLEGTMEYATMQLNLATALSEAGQLTEASPLYDAVLSAYQAHLPVDDMRLAGLHNNLALHCGRRGDGAQAIAHLQQALAIADACPQAKGEAAITRTNLAALFLRAKDMERAERCLAGAGAFFDAEGIEDPHRASYLAACAQAAYLRGDAARAAETYEQAAQGHARAYGKNAYYGMLCKNAAQAWDAAGQPERAARMRACAEA